MKQSKTALFSFATQHTTTSVERDSGDSKRKSFHSIHRQPAPFTGLSTPNGSFEEGEGGCSNTTEVRQQQSEDSGNIVASSSNPRRASGNRPELIDESIHHRRHSNISVDNQNSIHSNDSSPDNDEVKVHDKRFRIRLFYFLSSCCNNNINMKNGFLFSIRKFFIMCSRIQCMNSTRLLVLVVLSLQNSLFTVLRRYSQGVLREMYSKYEVLLVGEVIKIIFSAIMIRSTVYSDYSLDRQRRSSTLATSSLPSDDNNDSINNQSNAPITKSFSKVYHERIIFVIANSGKMIGLAIIYGIMNILSFVSLRNIGAGMFTIFAQCKILTTATFSTIILKRQYSYTKWRALASLMAGVILFSEPIWSQSFIALSNKNTRLLEEADENSSSSNLEQPSVFIGTMAVIIEVTLSGFASIYFEKVVKLDPLQLNIWERNFQLALGSFPVYLAFMAYDGGGQVGYFGGWSYITMVVALLGAAGGILVALSIKYGDAILKTLATTAAIILSSFLDYIFLKGDLTPTMCIAAFQVIVAITDYTFDATPEEQSTKDSIPTAAVSSSNVVTSDKDSEHGDNDDDDEGIPLMEVKRSIA